MAAVHGSRWSAAARLFGHTRLRRWLFCALAPLVAACGGDSATAPSPPLPNQAPVATGTIPAQTVVIGETGTVNVSGYFNDPGGDALTYSASSSDASVATVTVSGSTVTVTPVTQGMATVTVTARDPGGLSAQQSFTVTVPNRPPEVLVTVTPDTITTDEILDFGPVADLFIDPDGDALTYAASSSDTEVALANLTDGEFTVWSVAAGTTTITVMATDPGELSAELSFQVTVTTAGRSPVSITGVEPEVLVEGEAATITGTGFSTTGPDNLVSIGGLAATVTSASETSLSIMVPGADCLPPRRAELRVAIAASSDVRTVGVTPVIPEEPVQVTDAGDGCLHLPGNEAGGEYLIGVVSISEDVSSLTPVTLNGTPGDATVVGAARYAAAPGVPAAMLEAAASLTSRPVQPRTAAQVQTRLPASAGRDSIRMRHARAHLEMRERDRALWRELGPAIPSSLDGAKAIRRREAAVGDTWDFHMNAMSCTEFETISAVVRLVSNDLVWLDDLDNPSETFSDAHLEFLDGLYTSYVKGVHADYFGSLSDVDGNGRVLILMTKEINRNDGVLASVNPGDLRRGPPSGLPVHRGMVQPAPAAFEPRLRVAGPLRGPVAAGRRVNTHPCQGLYECCASMAQSLSLPLRLQRSGSSSPPGFGLITKTTTLNRPPKRGKPRAPRRSSSPVAHAPGSDRPPPVGRASSVPLPCARGTRPLAP